MDLAEILKKYSEIDRQINELEEKKKYLRAAILTRVVDPKTEIDSYTVYRYSRVSVKTALNDARLFDATRMEETVDKERLKELFKKGEKVPGISEVQYLRITSSKASTDESSDRESPEESSF